MTFLKAIWRIITGVKDVLVLCFLLLFFGGLYALLSMTPGERPLHTHEARCSSTWMAPSWSNRKRQTHSPH